MTIKRKRFTLGVELSPADLTAEDLSREGELAYDSSDDRLKYRKREDFSVQENSTSDTLEKNNHSFLNDDKVIYSGSEYFVINSNQNDFQLSDSSGGSAIDITTDNAVVVTLLKSDEIIDSIGAQSLQNKTIDATAATGNNTLSADSANIIYDDTSEAVISLGRDVQAALDAVKVALDNQNDANEIETDNSGNSLTALNVQTSLDEVAGRLDATESSTTTAQTTIDDHIADVTDAHTASAITNVPSGNLAATDVQAALDELQSDIDTRVVDGGSFTSGSVITPTQLDVKQDTEANLVTYASTASDGQIVFATDSKKMFQIIDNELQPIGGGGSTQFEIEQVGHGFSVGDGIYHDSSQPVGSEWQLAQADNADTLAYHVVIERIDDDNFIAADFGRVEVPSHGFTVGQYYFLSDSVAGQPTTTEPSSFSNPLFYVETADILQIKCLRPEQVGADTNLDDLSDVSVSAPSDGEALVYNNSTGLWEAQTITAAPTPVALDDLTDVDATTPSDGDTLVYNSGSGNYELQPTATQNVNIAALNIDWSSNAVYYKDISADTTFTFSNDTDGQTIIVILNNTDVNPHAITFPSGILTDPNYDGNVEATTESVFTFIKSNGKIYISEVKELS